MSSKQKGQALVEAALVLPVVLALLMAVLSFGSLYSTQIMITNASREGARFGTLGRSDAEIRARVKTYLGGTNLVPDKVSFNLTNAGGASGTDVTVRLTYPVELVIPVPGLPNPLNVTSQATMRIE